MWWFAAYGELGGGLGLLVGGVLASERLIHWLGDLLTGFSGITLCCIVTGVIWVSEPESLMDVLLYDYVHTLLGWEVCFLHSEVTEHNPFILKEFSEIVSLRVCSNSVDLKISPIV